MLKDKNLTLNKSSHTVKLLIVDDSEYIRKRLTDLIEDTDICSSIYEAKNSEEAINLFKEKNPDIVILDIRIPGDNGIKILQRIKSLNHLSKVIMLTNFPYDQYRSICIESGAEHFFSKSEEFEKIPDVYALLAESFK